MISFHSIVYNIFVPRWISSNDLEVIMDIGSLKLDNLGSFAKYIGMNGINLYH